MLFYLLKAGLKLKMLPLEKGAGRNIFNIFFVFCVDSNGLFSSLPSQTCPASYRGLHFLLFCHLRCNHDLLFPASRLKLLS